MASIHLLGTGAAISDPHRTTTMLAAESEGRCVLIDCGGDVVHRMLLAGLDPATIDALIVTHEHPDHVSGFPLFMLKIWLGKRNRPLDVYGIPEAIAQTRRVFEAFDTSRWDMPEIHWHEVSCTEGCAVYQDRHWTITGSPGTHPVPVIGLRLEHRQSGSVVAYSCDTAPSESIQRLASGAHLLIHEANGISYGHSSIEDAARTAAAAAARKLVLVHLPPGLSESDLDEARTLFPDVALGEELDRFAL